MPPIAPPPPSPVEQKLESILTIIEQMNRRDKLRTVGGFLRGILSLLPILIFLWATWYTIQNSDELLKKITSMAAEQAGRVVQQKATDASELLKALQRK